MPDLHRVQKHTALYILCYSLGSLSFSSVTWPWVGSFAILTIYRFASTAMVQNRFLRYQDQGRFAMWGGARHQIDALIAEYRAAGCRQEIQSASKELRKEHPISVPKDLAYVEGKLFEDYIHDMRITQHFAVFNRKAMT